LGSLREILSILEEKSTGIPSKHIDWSAFHKLEKFYTRDPNEFKDAIRKLFEAAFNNLNEAVPATLEWIREEKMLFDVLGDVLWFLNAKLINDKEITKVLVKLNNSFGALFYPSFRRQVETYFFSY